MIRHEIVMIKRRNMIFLTSLSGENPGSGDRPLPSHGLKGDAGNQTSLKQQLQNWDAGNQTNFKQQLQNWDASNLTNCKHQQQRQHGHNKDADV